MIKIQQRSFFFPVFVFGEIEIGIYVREQDRRTVSFLERDKKHGPDRT